jgi:hypothetical protein
MIYMAVHDMHRDPPNLPYRALVFARPDHLAQLLDWFQLQLRINIIMKKLLEIIDFGGLDGPGGPRN